ncbi:MAG: AraC family transcriptional regulator [Mucilaginibacter sp.]
MKNCNIIREITPLVQRDCFMLFSRVKDQFTFPLHYHDEFELNLLLNAPGARRIVGNHMDVIQDAELALIGPNLIHAWFTHNCKSTEITEITIQFHKDLFEQQFLTRNQLRSIKEMFERSSLGVLFSQEAIGDIKSRIMNLGQKTGFDSVLELMSILYKLSLSKDYHTLADSGYSDKQINYNSRRIQKAFDYMSVNYSKPLFLSEVAAIANMPEVSFSRFIKKRTGTTFIESLNEIRIGHASRMLIDSTDTVSEIAYLCGFNNISNFNRTFKKKKKCTPKEFRENYLDNRIFI